MCQCCTSASRKKKKKAKNGTLGRNPSSEHLIKAAGEGAYTAFDSASILSGDSADALMEEREEEEEEEGEEEGGVAYHTIIIDCAPIGFADSMGVAMIEQVYLLDLIT